MSKASNQATRHQPIKQPSQQKPSMKQQTLNHSVSSVPPSLLTNQCLLQAHRRVVLRLDHCLAGGFHGGATDGGVTEHGLREGVRLGVPRVRGDVHHGAGGPGLFSPLGLGLEHDDLFVPSVHLIRVTLIGSHETCMQIL
jgi:hypothetical protein